MYKWNKYIFSHYEEGMAIYYHQSDINKKNPHSYYNPVKRMTPINGNNSFYNKYPRLAYEHHVNAYEYYDTNVYNDIKKRSEFYYGYKECQKLGITYTAPNPVENNNLPR